MLTRTALVALFLIVAGSAPVHGQSQVAELNAAGWKMIQAGDGARAGRYFADALSVRPDDPVLLLGAGAAAHLRGEPKEAIARLRGALDANPRLIQASRLLGQLAYNEGDVALAINTYERALSFAPDDRELKEALAAWRADAEVHRSFVEERRYDRFRVMFQGRADEPLAADATGILNDAFWRIGRTLGAYPSDAVVVMLYTEQQFRDVTRAPEWSDGVYDGRIRIPAAGASKRPDTFERVLVHELAHAMITSIAADGVPAWLHEGLAQHFEGENVAAARRRLKAAGRVIPLSNLEVSFTHLDAAGARIAYDQSLIAVDMLLQRPGFVWTRLLHELSGSTRTEAALRSFGISYSDLESSF